MDFEKLAKFGMFYIVCPKTGSVFKFRFSVFYQKITGFRFGFRFLLEVVFGTLLSPMRPRRVFKAHYSAIILHFILVLEHSFIMYFTKI